MRLYRTTTGIVIEDEGKIHSLKNVDWDSFVNDDNLLGKMRKAILSSQIMQEVPEDILAPVCSQELWASGVTYFRSKQGRQEESKNAGGGDYYARVYEAERPELFFKANSNRIVGPGGRVRIRKDSSWNVPEPELTLMITSSGKIVGYTVGNDMSSRSLEGENPLYLPQAKTYDGCAAVGPCIYVTGDPLPKNTQITLDIRREGESVFNGETEISQLKRELTHLVSFLYRECSFPHGSLLLTGTGIVPGSEFTLRSGDEIIISIDSIGTLKNTVE